MPSTNKNENNNIMDTDTEWGQAVFEKPILGVPPVVNSSSKEETKEGRQSSRSSQHADDDDDDDDEIIDIAIIGGGLVGLAVAIGLSKTSLHVKVYERASELRSQSQGILAIHPNGMNALNDIDPKISHRIAQVGCERHQRIVTNIKSDGNVTEIVEETGKESIEKYGRTAVGITWHNCQQVLASLLVPNKDDDVSTIINTSRSLSYYVEHNDYVTLYFDDGTTAKSKIVLGCDGVFSAVRRQMYPNDSPIYFGQLNWGTVIETSKLPQNIHPSNGVHYFQNKGEPRWMCMVSDGGSDYSFWQFRVSDLKRSMELSGNHGRGGLGLVGVKEKLIEIAKHSSCTIVAEIIKTIPENQIFERSIVGHSSVPTWLSSSCTTSGGGGGGGGGKVALVGDSAHGMHPNIAQGANSAFESAAAIVKAIRKEQQQQQQQQAQEEEPSANTDVNYLKEALKEYEKARKPRAEYVQGFANLLGVLQSSGKNYFEDNPTVIGDMLEWIRSGRDPIKLNEQPPQDVINILDGYDPCSETGVSRLWT